MSLEPASLLRRTALSVPAVGTLLAVGLRGAHASTDNSAGNTFAEILRRRKVVIGIVVDFPPFGFLNAKHEPVGLDIEFSRALADALGTELELVQTSDAGRIPFLNTGKVDLLVADLGITPGRAKEVMFTIPYSGARAILYAPEDKKITDISGLVGLRVAVARGSSNAIFLHELAPAGIKILSFDSDGIATQAVLSGQADALVQSDTNINALLQRNPSDRAKLNAKFVLATQGDALAVRMHDFVLSQYLNTFVYYMKSTGKLDALYRKWVRSPLPPLPTF